MDINVSSQGGNYSAVNGYAPPRKKVKPFGSFADSNSKAVGVQSNKQANGARKNGKKVPNGRQNLGGK